MALVIFRNNIRQCTKLIKRYKVSVSPVTSFQSCNIYILFGSRSCGPVGLDLDPLHLGCRHNLQIVHRNKTTKNRSDSTRDSDDEDEEEVHISDLQDKDSRVLKLKVNSLRTDLIIKAGLGIARNKVEALFYDSKIRVNGQKIFKKSVQLHAGDEVDIIRGVSPMNSDFILVSRIEILSAKDTSEGSVSVQLRRTKSLTIENYDEPWKAVKQD